MFLAHGKVLILVVMIILFAILTRRRDTNSYFSNPDNGHDKQEETKGKQRNCENIRKIIFMYLIFEFVRKSIRKKNGPPSGKNGYFSQENRRGEKWV